MTVWLTAHSSPLWSERFIKAARPVLSVEPLIVCREPSLVSRSMLPESPLAKSNRRGCFLLLTTLALALLIMGLLASRTADTAKSDEAVSKGGPTAAQ
jgi:hypothetical protein